MNENESFRSIPLEIEPSLADHVKVDSFLLTDVSTLQRTEALEDKIERLSAEYRIRWPNPSSALEALRPARKLYHALGIDPSKTRPSSEALLRRVLKDKPLFQVNAIVDAANLASLTLLLPVGLYDAAKLEPPIILRYGREGEGYPGIRKDTVHLRGRPTLADRVGAFGNPTSDSMRTCVTDATRVVWFVLFAPADHPDTAMRRDLHRARAILERFGTR